MSVLLEALKKAAENKKQIEDSSNKGVDELEGKAESTELAVDYQVTTSDEQNTVGPEEKVADKPQTEVGSAEGAGSVSSPKLNLTISAEAAEPAKFAQPDLSAEEEPEQPAVPESGDTQEAEEQSASNPSGGLSLSLVNETSAIQALENQEIPAKAVAAELGSASVFTTIDSNPQSKLETISDAETVPSGGMSSTISSSVSTNDQETPEEDSYKWSLEALPGYQADEKQAEVLPSSAHLAQPSTSAPNPILSTNQRFRHLKPAGIKGLLFGGSSNFVVYSLMTLLVLSVLGAVAVSYFYRESEAVEQSMRKYTIAKLPDAPASTVAGSGVAEEKAATSDSAASSVDPTSSDGVEPSTSKTPEETQQAGSATLAASSMAVKLIKPFVQSKVEKPTVKTELVQLNIQSREEQSSLRLAYDALHSRDFTTAESHFQAILSDNPKNVDALNGMASIYAQQNQVDKALEHYYRALENDADNLYAYESVILLSGNQLSGESWKKELNRIIGKHPKSAVLHYALGNLYARENDWTRAQSAFFEAHLLDRQNPDYLINLAISLDHLGEYALASEYYTNALVFAESGRANFDTAAIKARLANIKVLLGQNRL